MSQENLNTDGKYSFINQTSVASSIATNPTTQKMKKSYLYFFVYGMNSVQFCKKFYLATLEVRQKMVYNTQQKKDQISTTAISDEQDKHGKQRRFSPGDKETIICYVNSFPAVRCTLLMCWN